MVRSDVRPPTTRAPRTSADPSMVPMSSIRCSPLELTLSFILFFTSPTLLPVRPETLLTSAVVPYIPFPFPFATFVAAEAAGLALVSCNTDWVEFCLARDNVTRTVGAGLLRCISFAGNVPAIGEDATMGELTPDALVFALRNGFSGLPDNPDTMCLPFSTWSRRGHGSTTSLFSLI